MVARKRISILPPAEETKFFSSGCALLDCVLGGGWARGKVINVVGDKSTGKTLLAIEASANFVRGVAGGKVTYVEAEAAFDPEYARILGLPEERLDLVTDISTVEGLWRRIETIIKTKEEHLVIVDSLDALTDEAEIEREIGGATYGAAKSKLLSEGFRKLIRGMGATNLTLFIISQVRDKIGAPAFAKQVQRSGGHALDFYASQVLWLYEEAKIKKTVGGLERPIGMNVKCRCEKNKVGWPWRECLVPIIYGYGMDDVKAGLEWLAKAKPNEFSQFGDTKIRADSYKRHVEHLDRATVAKVVSAAWEEIDKEFRPERRKYESGSEPSA